MAAHILVSNGLSGYGSPTGTILGPMLCRSSWRVHSDTLLNVIEKTVTHDLSNITQQY